VTERQLVTERQPAPLYKQLKGAEKARFRRVMDELKLLSAVDTAIGIGIFLLLWIILTWAGLGTQRTIATASALAGVAGTFLRKSIDRRHPQWLREDLEAPSHRDRLPNDEL
jgi:hypothetical protein